MRYPRLNWSLDRSHPCHNSAVVVRPPGFGAIIASRLGLKTRSGGEKYPTKTICIDPSCGCLAFANHWQWQRNKSQEQQRLQATLTRPAQFDGTKIKDAELKETSYTAQETHAQGITTKTPLRSFPRM